MGWYDAGPLALKSAKSFSGIARQFAVNSKPSSGTLSRLACFRTLPKWDGLLRKPERPLKAVKHERFSALQSFSLAMLSG